MKKTRDVNKDYKKTVLFLMKNDFSEEECFAFLTRFLSKHRYLPDSLYSKIIELHSFFINNGFNNQMIKKILIRFYPILSYDLTTFEEKFNALRKLNFTSSDIIRMCNNNAPVLGISKEQYAERFIFLKSLGYSHNDIIIMSRKSPTLLVCKEEIINNKISYFESLGMTREDAVKVFKKSPSSIGFTEETSNNKIKHLLEMGFKYDVIISIIKVSPSILSINEDTVEQKIKSVMDLGFTKEETIKLFSTQKTLFSSTSVINERIELLEELGYSHDESLLIFKGFPGIASISKESIIEKVEFLKSIGLRDMLLRTPKQLIQSSALTKARYDYFKELGIEVSMSNFRKLFISGKQFKKQYSISNEDVVKKYIKETE